MSCLSSCVALVHAGAVQSHAKSLDDDVIEIMSFALTEHMNLVATVSRGYDHRVHLLLWSYDKARLLAACAMPDADQSVPEMTAMQFLDPYPALLTADDSVRYMHLFDGSVDLSQCSCIHRRVASLPL